MAYLKPQSPLQHKDGDYFYPLTTVDQIIMEDGSRLNNKFVTPKAGFIYPLATSTVPEGFLLCDGAEYSRTEYKELFAAIGTMYGAGNGSTTFNVPNLQTRVPVGAGEGYKLGDVGGEEKHTLTTDEMPNHNHVQTGVNAYATSSVRLDMQNDGNVVIYDASGALWSTNTSSTAGSNQYRAVKIGVDGNTGDSGGNKPHNNMQPYTVVNYIIATGKDTGVSVHDIITGAQALPLGVEFGGTDATNAADARRNLEITPENIGAMKMELLWKNASPTSVFEAQTISLDLSQYDRVCVDFYASKNYSLVFNVSSNISDKFIASYVWGDTGSYAHRSGIVSSTGVQFYRAYYNKVEDTNDVCIPARIYGIKGVIV